MNMWQSEMKILKSKYHKQGYIVMNQKKYKIEILPVNEIWPSVPKAVKHRGKPFYKELTVDIKANGLHFPLMVVTATRKQINEQKKIWGAKLCDLPFDIKETKKEKLGHIEHYVAWGGSQRVRVAEELGYTHIDCAMMPSFQRAHKLQKVMRVPYVARWY